MRVAHAQQSQDKQSPDTARPGRREGADVAEQQGSAAFGALLAKVPADIRDVSFATALRGYDRAQVDAYVARVNRVIAELEIGHSPQSAVKHALDRVGEQTSGVLQRAREVAEELTATALAESEHATRRAKVEAEEIIERARTQAEQLRAESSAEAEEALSQARERSEERLSRTDERIRERQLEAEGRLGSLQQEIAIAARTREAALEDLRRTATELRELADGGLGQDGEREVALHARDAPTEQLSTEQLPARTVAGASRPLAPPRPTGKAGDGRAAGRARARVAGRAPKGA